MSEFIKWTVILSFVTIATICFAYMVYLFIDVIYLGGSGCQPPSCM